MTAGYYLRLTWSPCIFKNLLSCPLLSLVSEIINHVYCFLAREICSFFQILGSFLSLNLFLWERNLVFIEFWFAIRLDLVIDKFWDGVLLVKRNIAFLGAQIHPRFLSRNSSPVFLVLVVLDWLLLHQMWQIKLLFKRITSVQFINIVATEYIYGWLLIINFSLKSTKNMFITLYHFL